jgi:transcriptional regulator with XRE-family HTH domain
MTKSVHKRQVGKNLRLIREALGLSQRELAERYGLTDKSQVSNWERGLNYPDPYFVWRFFEIDGVTADWVFLGKRWHLPASMEANLPATATALAEPASGTSDRQAGKSSA